MKVIEALRKTEGLEGFNIEDAGVCGLDLLNLIDGARKVIIVDEILAGSHPGKCFCSPPPEKEKFQRQIISAHRSQLIDR